MALPKINLPTYEIFEGNFLTLVRRIYKEKQFKSEK